MNKSLEQVVKEADDKIPRDAVSSRSAGAGKALSYLETWYVIDRLNKVFGNMGWDSETLEMVQVSGPTDKHGNMLPAYRARVRITAMVFIGNDPDGRPGYVKVCKDGTGWGSDKSIQNPHEMASKEAESDALKRAAMKFGMSFGLALYDKSQENVEDAPKPAAAAAPAPANTREALNKRITNMSKVVIAKRRMTADELRAEMKTQYGAETKEALNDVSAAKFLERLEGLASAT